MKRFDQLTTRGQVRRLRRLAAEALSAFGLPDARFELIQHWENSTFRVNIREEQQAGSITDRVVPGRYLLRLHRPDEISLAYIESEMAWLEALARDTDLCVPTPVRSPDGRLALEYANADFPELDGDPEGRRVCSLLRWVPGRLLKGKARRLVHMQRLGGLMAQLHQHAATWSPPFELNVNRWDGPTLMGRHKALGIEPDVWDELPAKESDLFAACEERLTSALDKLGQGPDVFGLIHADLHFNNVLYAGGEARPIDFNDCGHGHFVLDAACALLGFDPPDGEQPWRAAFAEGYEQHRPLPPQTMELLDLFLAARQVTLMLWCYSCARHREAFREMLPRWRASLLPDLTARLNCQSAQ
ncbi:MAG: phosphotransferase [Planctomycetota bacterium]